MDSEHPGITDLQELQLVGGAFVAIGLALPGGAYGSSARQPSAKTGRPNPAQTSTR
jgi:hypothetical protein